MVYDGKVLANVFKRNKMVIDRQVKDLSHEDSLLQPEVRGNCLNFILGHLIVYRESMHKMLGLPEIVSGEEIDRYDHGAEPILGDERGVMRLERLLAMLEQSTDIIIEALEKLPADELEKEVKIGESSSTLGQRLEFQGWHETYHVGQTEYLRQLAGTDDKVI